MPIATTSAFQVTVYNLDFGSQIQDGQFFELYGEGIQRQTKG